MLALVFLIILIPSLINLVSYNIALMLNRRNRAIAHFSGNIGVGPVLTQLHFAEKDPPLVIKLLPWPFPHVTHVLEDNVPASRIMLDAYVHFGFMALCIFAAGLLEGPETDIVSVFLSTLPSTMVSIVTAPFRLDFWHAVAQNGFVVSLATPVAENLAQAPSLRAALSILLVLCAKVALWLGTLELIPVIHNSVGNLLHIKATMYYRRNFIGNGNVLAHLSSAMSAMTMTLYVLIVMLLLMDIPHLVRGIITN